MQEEPFQPPPGRPPMSLLAVDDPSGGVTIVSGHADGTVQLHSGETGQTIARHNLHDAAVWALASLTLNGERLIASGSGDGQVLLWGLDTGKEVGRLPTHDGTVWALTVVRDGERPLLVSADDSSIRTWEPTELDLVTDLSGHDGAIWALSTLDVPDGPLVVSGGADGTVRVWFPAVGKERQVFTGHTDWVRALTAVHVVDRTLIVSGGGGDDGSIRFWDSDDESAVRVVRGHIGSVRALGESEVGGRSVVVSSGDDGAVRVWDAESYDMVRELSGNTGSVWALTTFRREGRPFAVAGDGGGITMWNLENGEQVGSFDVDRDLDDSADETELETDRDVAERTDFGQDRPAVDDVLGRRPLAHYLAAQVENMAADEPGGSFAVHVSGAWGTGKSSLINFLCQDLDSVPTRARRWVVPPNYFDAWRESRLGPTWWSLLTYLRTEVRRAQPTRRGRAWFTVREWWRRMTMAISLHAIGTFVLITLLAAASYFLAFRRQGWADGIPAALGWIGAVAASLSLIAGLSLTAARALLWRSPAGARLFQRTDSNPFDDVARHATWMRRQLGDRSLLIVIDDLDRCGADYVVELLEAMQTLIRPTDNDTAAWKRGNGGGDPSASPSTTVFVVAADAAWLNTAFESRYQSFVAPVGEPGRPLGHLFTAKIFQLQLRVPDVEADRVADFGRHVLKLDDATAAAAGQSTKPTFDLQSAEQALEDAESSGLDQMAAVVRNAPTDGATVTEQIRLQETFARKVAEPRQQRAIQHRLEPFIHLLDPNPRSIVRFINAMSVGIVVNAVRRRAADFDELARWTVLEHRWPTVAEFLSDKPVLVDDIAAGRVQESDLTSPGAPPYSLITSDDVARAVTSPGMLPLTADGIRRCCGLPAAAYDTG